MALEYQITKMGAGGATAVLSLRTSVDTSAAQELDGILIRLAKKRRGGLVLDVTNVDYISSSGWRAFLGAIRARGSSRSIAIAGMRPAVRDVYELLCFAEIMDAYATVPEAVAALEARALSST
jgi:anti-anti-sigma factor